MAGMEGFGGLLGIALLVTSYLLPKYLPKYKLPKLQQMTPSKIFNCSILILAFAIVLSGFFAEAPTIKAQIDIIAQARFVLILYALTAVMNFYHQKIERIYFWILILSIMIGVYAIVQSFIGFDPLRNSIYYKPSAISGLFFWRAKGFFSNTMAYSYSLSMLFCLIFSGLLTGYTKIKGRHFHLTAVSAATILGISLIMTFTRGAWVSLVIAMPVMIVFYLRKRGLTMLLPALALLVLLVATVQPLRQRALSVVNTQEGSISRRFDLWEINWRMFLDHPIVGVGYGENSNRTLEYHQNIFPDKKPFLANAHNNILQTLAGIGVIGFVPWFIFGTGLLIMTIQGIFKSGFAASFTNTVLVGSLGAQVVMHLGGITQTTFYDKEVQHMFLFLTALTLMVLSSLAARQIHLEVKK